MRTNRLEAFSDGVFAIVITLLVLDIHLPDVPYSSLTAALWAALPRISAYVLSFVVIGLYWIFHYVYLDRLKFVNGTLIGLNLLMLLLTSFMPIPTGLIGRYPLQPWPIFLYGLCLLALNMTGMTTLIYLYQHPTLMHQHLSHQDFKRQLRVYIWVNLPYVLAIAITFTLPVASYLIFFVIFIFVGLNLWKQLNRIQYTA